MLEAITVFSSANCNLNNLSCLNLYWSGSGAYHGSMKPYRQNSVLELLPAQVLRLNAAAGVTIYSDGGTVWVTQEGLARDDFLSAGESLCIVSDGVTLVEIIGNTAARLTMRPRHVSGRVISAFQARVA